MDSATQSEGAAVMKYPVLRCTEGGRGGAAVVEGRAGASGFVMEAGARVWSSGGDVWLVDCVWKSHKGLNSYGKCFCGYLKHAWSGSFVEGCVRE